MYVPATHSIGCTPSAEHKYPAHLYLWRQPLDVIYGLPVATLDVGQHTVVDEWGMIELRVSVKDSLPSEPANIS